MSNRVRRLIITGLALLLSLALGGCAPPAPEPVSTAAVAKPPLPLHAAVAEPTLSVTPAPFSPTPAAPPAASRTPTASPTRLATSLATSGPSPSPAPTETLTPSPTIPPLAGYTIDALAARQYGEGDLHVQEELPSDRSFHQYVLEYISDGVQVTGLAYVPFGEGPFPVIIVLHGYIAPEVYYRGLDAAVLADTYAQNGYAVIMPDYRGYMGTAGGPNPMRIPYAIDVLNLIGVLDMLDVLDETRVGVIGHSMGGGVATYIMVLSRQVDAMVLYGSMSADQRVNWDYIGETWARYWMDRTARDYGSPESHPELYAAISPINYLDRVSMPVQIHHGDADTIVPVEWSRELAEQMQAAGKPVTLYEYPGAPHTFSGPELHLLRQRTLAFFNTHVKYKDSGLSGIQHSAGS